MNNNNIEHILVKYPEQDRGFLIPILQEVQQYQGYISPEVVNDIQDFTGVAAGEIFGVATKEVVPVDDRRIAALARHYSVSREVILRKILDRRMINEANYKEKIEEWVSQAEGDGGRGNYYATQASYLGNAYLRLVFSKHYQGKISLEQVADYLGVRSKSVGGLEELVLRRTAA